MGLNIFTYILLEASMFFAEIYYQVFKFKNAQDEKPHRNSENVIKRKCCCSRKIKLDNKIKLFKREDDFLGRKKVTEHNIRVNTIP